MQNKTKPVPTLFILLTATLVVLFASCNEPIFIHDISRLDTCLIIKNNNTTHSGGFGLDIKENSIDDNIRVMSIKVAPGYTGELFSPANSYSDSQVVCIERLNARKGSIAIIRH
ncbi:hypothetical protein SAMN04488132_10578 [Sediminibacterium ginsengisoli]|uniref:Lipoprotein n=1 Tax=Sediminibacterium ginsengisoli TaxID=413434 RepID=A0A1T4NZZ1_9BACT|nr:hypothetical protein SAMN04488132_10578 [Sediminibacterium ginsengisoli]